jgi:hypothetical protein
MGEWLKLRLNYNINSTTLTFGLGLLHVVLPLELPSRGTQKLLKSQQISIVLTCYVMIFPQMLMKCLEELFDFWGGGLNESNTARLRCLPKENDEVIIIIMEHNGTVH